MADNRLGRKVFIQLTQKFVDGGVEAYKIVKKNYSNPSGRRWYDTRISAGDEYWTVTMRAMAMGCIPRLFGKSYTVSISHVYSEEDAKEKAAEFLAEEARLQAILERARDTYSYEIHPDMTRTLQAARQELEKKE